MKNKNHFITAGTIQLVDKEYLLLEYVPDPNDPRHDDLPSEILEKGNHYDVTFKSREKEPEEPFNE